MFDRDAMARTTFTTDRKYFVRAEAKWRKPKMGSARIFVSAEVFEGNPSITGNEPIHYLAEKAEGTDLLDAIQSIEAAARQHIATHYHS